MGKANKQGEEWNTWTKDTTLRPGNRERDLEDYEGILGFKRTDLKDKKVLDIGSGRTEMFSRELRTSVGNAEVVSLNPDYSLDKVRRVTKENKDWPKMSVAGTGQELPFKDNSFDEVLALWSLTAFSSPNMNLDAVSYWAREIARVLKPGGEARVGPTFCSLNEQDVRDEYRVLVETVEKLGLSVNFEMIKKSEVLGLDKDEKDRHVFMARIIIKKPI